MTKAIAITKAAAPTIRQVTIKVVVPNIETIRLSLTIKVVVSIIESTTSRREISTL